MSYNKNENKYNGLPQNANLMEQIKTIISEEVDKKRELPTADAQRPTADGLWPTYSDVAKGVAKGNEWTRVHDNRDNSYDEDRQLKRAIEESEREERERKSREARLKEMEIKKREEEQRRKEEEGLRQLKLVSAKKMELQKEMAKILEYPVFYDQIVIEIKTALNKFEAETNTAIFERRRERPLDYFDTSDLSLVIIEVIKIFEGRNDVSNEKVVNFFIEHVMAIQRECTQKCKLFIFDPQLHKRDEGSEFAHQALDGQFVCADIRGDGNCLWNSISVSLFGDYSHMESLRLITASTLIQFRREFERYIKDQKSKYGYKHELTFDQLIDAALDLNVWGDELHVLALSLALRRPIYSYGSLLMLISDDNMSYEELRSAYESDSQPLHNHFRYTANIEDEKKEPILLYYNGENHYSVVLPMRAGIRALRPQSVLLEPLFDREVVVKEEPKEDINEVFFDCNSYKESKTHSSDLTANVTDLGLDAFTLNKNVGSSVILTRLDYQLKMDELRKDHELRERELRRDHELRERELRAEIKVLRGDYERMNRLYTNKDIENIELKKQIKRLSIEKDSMLDVNRRKDSHIQKVNAEVKRIQYELKESQNLLRVRETNGLAMSVGYGRNAWPGTSAPVCSAMNDQAHCKADEKVNVSYQRRPIDSPDKEVTDEELSSDMDVDMEFEANTREQLTLKVTKL